MDSAASYSPSHSAVSRRGTKSSLIWFIINTHTYSNPHTHTYIYIFIVHTLRKRELQNIVKFLSLGLLWPCFRSCPLLPTCTISQSCPQSRSLSLSFCLSLSLSFSASLTLTAALCCSSK